MAIIDLTESLMEDGSKSEERREIDSSSEMEADIKGSEDSTAGTTTPAQIEVTDTKLCGVCKQNPHKYKCTRCLLRYCSVACSTVHKASHPAVTPDSSPPSSKPSPNTGSKSHELASKPLAGTVAAAGSKGPFAALDDSKELQTLFKMYPGLRSILEDINTATLRPIDNMDNGYSYGSHKSKNSAWNQDKGTENGIRELKKARLLCGKDGEGVREFSKLILQILSNEDGLDAAEMVQQELDEENTRIIQQLLQAEKR